MRSLGRPAKCFTGYHQLGWPVTIPVNKCMVIAVRCHEDAVVKLLGRLPTKMPTNCKMSRMHCSVVHPKPREVKTEGTTCSIQLCIRAIPTVVLDHRSRFPKASKKAM